MPGLVRTIEGILPPRRYDGLPWTGVFVQEAATPAGAWVQIDEQDFSDPDVDPAAPKVRNVTTVLGVLDPDWCRAVLFDADGNTSEATDPVRSSGQDEVLPPSPERVRDGSPLLRSKYPVTPTTPYQAGDMREVVYQATALVQANTWRLIDPTLGCSAPEGEVCELVPDALVPVAIQAITRMSERLEVTTEPAFAAQVATGRRLRGFNAGPYSESYFAPGEFARRGASQGRPPMDTDDALDAALWALATEAARDYFVWRATGVAAPVGVASPVDYRKESVGYTAGMSRGRRGLGPDGF